MKGYEKYCPLIFLMLFSTFARARENIAVLDFKAAKVSVADSAAAIAISAFMRTSLVKTKRFNVVERKKIDKALAEQGLQETICATKECAVQIGKILKVQKTIIGSYRKDRNLHFITVKVVDIKTGKIIRSEKVECANLTNLDSAIDEIVSLIAIELESPEIQAKLRKRDDINAKKLAIQEEKLRKTQEIEERKRDEELKETKLLSKEKRLKKVWKKIQEQKKLKKRREKIAAKPEHIGSFAIGLHGIGGSLRYFAGIPTLEAKAVYGATFTAFGPRLYLNLNPYSNAVIYIGGEYCVIKGESELQKYTGTATGAFIGLELFIRDNFSFLLDIGPYTITLDSEYDGIAVSSSYSVGNIGVNLYF